jgi:hypothetical protein
MTRNKCANFIIILNTYVLSAFIILFGLISIIPNISKYGTIYQKSKNTPIYVITLINTTAAVVGFIYLLYFLLVKLIQYIC